MVFQRRREIPTTTKSWSSGWYGNKAWPSDKRNTSKFHVSCILHKTNHTPELDMQERATNLSTVSGAKHLNRADMTHGILLMSGARALYKDLAWRNRLSNSSIFWGDLGAEHTVYGILLDIPGARCCMTPLGMSPTEALAVCYENTQKQIRGNGWQHRTEGERGEKAIEQGETGRNQR